jgi:hypothetical protein
LGLRILLTFTSILAFIPVIKKISKVRNDYFNESYHIIMLFITSHPPGAWSTKFPTF